MKILWGKKILIAVAVIVVLGAGGTLLVINDFSGLLALSRANQRLWCEADGGSFGCGEGCYCVKDTDDQGKSCTDSDQCEGLCVAVRKKRGQERRASVRWLTLPSIKRIMKA